ncbi:MAG: OmpA family protein [Saprospiraceae bacterium]
MKKIILLLTLILGLSSNFLLNAAEYWVQVAVYDHNIGDDYFKDAGVTDVAMHLDGMDIYRYYVKGYNDENEAEIKKREILAKGFKHAKVVDIEELRELCKMACLPKTPAVKTIYFDFNKSKIKKKSEQILNDVSTLLVENPEMIVQLNGHTDEIGQIPFNNGLSMSRASQAKQYLIGRGISPSRIKTQAFGEFRPIALNKDKRGRDLPEGRKFNRRVEIIVSSKEDDMRELILSSQLLEIPLNLRLQ